MFLKYICELKLKAIAEWDIMGKKENQCKKLQSMYEGETENHRIQVGECINKQK